MNKTKKERQNKIEERLACFEQLAFWIKSNPKKFKQMLPVQKVVFQLKHYFDEDLIEILETSGLREFSEFTVDYPKENYYKHCYN